MLAARLVWPPPTVRTAPMDCVLVRGHRNSEEVEIKGLRAEACFATARGLPEGLHLVSGCHPISPARSVVMQPPPLCSLCSWPPVPRMRPLQSRSTKTPPERNRPHSGVPRVRWRRAGCTCPCTGSRGLRAASSCSEALGSPCSRATAARRTGNTASRRPRASATRCRARSSSCRRHPNTAYSSFRPAPTQARNCPAPRARRSTASRPGSELWSSRPRKRGRRRTRRNT
mmetsp:Transcript_23037/g.64816  ORF Transcript_23037/g.64816 Transcript_23037/m.64816 type:complete len:229 (+) Transcript_23037:188-874(+)